jgi:hypothetical protein
MPPEQSQAQPDMSPEEAKASLGIATHLQSGLMPQAPTSPGNEPGTTQQPEQGQDVQAEIQGLESRLMDELKTLREEMKTQGDGKAELQDLKKQIEEILNSSD